LIYIAGRKILWPPSIKTKTANFLNHPWKLQPHATAWVSDPGMLGLRRSSFQRTAPRLFLCPWINQTSNSEKEP